jgi:hypothetical protein
MSAPSVAPKLAGTLAALLTGLLVPATLLAQAPADPVVATDWGQIERLHSAWTQDAVGVNHSAPFVNSKRVDVITRQTVDLCATVNDGYATDPTDPGHKLHHAIILGAFLNGKPVRLTLQGCSFDHPRIIGVEVKQ